VVDWLWPMMIFTEEKSWKQEKFEAISSNHQQIKNNLARHLPIKRKFTISLREKGDNLNLFVWMIH